MATPAEPTWFEPGHTFHTAIMAFEEAWRTGQPQRIEDCLDVAGVDRHSFLLELIQVELDWRIRRQDAIVIDEYQGRFAELSDQDINDLRAECEKLINLHRNRPASRGIRHNDNQSVGAQIGPYKLLQSLGEGGMGAVWLAEQIEPVRRKVALKLIKPGISDRQYLARFEAERQALALMDHANIAKVLDAGTTPAGQPYFVMELVKGVPITQFCDREKLTIRQRLELFIPVCQAVQHAHQKGIIHRDLKPSNVLVGLYDARPVPKVIDFGVPKATGIQLTDKTLFTEVGAIVGTLEYMSPEQADLDNVDIDTRADTYSLGVILYELLTGSTPFHRKEIPARIMRELLRLIREVEPPKPSTRLSTSEELPSLAAVRKLEPRRLTSQIRGDLDWIVMKCLEKERGRRYETANGLAMDIQRYLADEPVLAGPPGVGYRMRKFVRRNRRGVIAAGILALAIIGGIGGTSVGLIRAANARALADLRFKQALDAYEEMVFDMQVLMEKRSSTLELRRELLDKARPGLERLLREAEVSGGGNHALVWSHLRLGRIAHELGDATTSEAECRNGLELARSIAVANRTSTEAQRDVAACFGHLGFFLLSVKRTEDALDCYQNSSAICQQLAASQSLDPKTCRDISVSYVQHGDVLMRLQRSTEALDLYQRALQSRQTFAAMNPMDREVQHDIGVIFERLGDVSLRRNRLSDAQDSFRQMQQVRIKMADANPKDIEIQNALAIGCAKLGKVALLANDVSESQQLYSQSLEIRRNLLAANPDSVHALRSVSIAYTDLGDLAGRQQLWQQAKDHLRLALEFGLKVANTRPDNALFQRDLTVVYDKLGSAARHLGQLDDALTYYQHYLEIAKKLSTAGRKSGQSQRDLSVAYLYVGSVSLELHRTEDAFRYFELAMQITQELAALDSSDADVQRDLGIIFKNQGDLLLLLNRPDDALDKYRKGMAIIEKLALLSGQNAQIQDDWAESFENIGAACLALSQFIEATDSFQKARHVAEKWQGPGKLNIDLVLLAKRLRFCNKADKAIDRLEFALDQPDEEIFELLVARLRALAKKGDIANCLTTAEAIIPRSKSNSDGLYTATAIWCLCCAHQTDPQDKRVAECGDKAMDFLRQAVAAGFKDVGRMKLDRALDPIRGRAEFAALIRSLESKQ